MRGFFAIVDEGGFARLEVDEHESAAADVAGHGVDHRQGKAGGDGRVDRISAGLHDLDPGVGGQVVDGDDHGVLGQHGRFPGRGLRGENGRAEQQGQSEQGHASHWGSIA